jgi:SAM-dependent methyltransferase
MDRPPVERWHESVLAEWTDEATAAAWRKWHAKIVVQSAAATAELIRAIELAPGQRVLDLASGSGDPALTLARLVGPSGSVIATDLGPAMLEVAEAEAAHEGLHNIEFRVTDAHELPFTDASFDRITCRFGVMYFADPLGALRECARVLRPLGRVALVAWGPLEEVPYLQLALRPFAARTAIPAPEEGAPHPLRYGRRGLLASELGAAGFENVQETWLRVPWPWPGPPEELWARFYEAAVPFHPVVNGLDPDERERAIAEATDAFRAHYDGEQVRMEVTIVIAAGTRV